MKGLLVNGLSHVMCLKDGLNIIVLIERRARVLPSFSWSNFINNRQLKPLSFFFIYSLSYDLQSVGVQVLLEYHNRCYLSRRHR